MRWFALVLLWRPGSRWLSARGLASQMGRGPKKHLKRLVAPKHWMLDKLTGRYAPRPSTGPHKLRESLPLVILLRERLKYALTYQEALMILKQRQVEVDGRARTDVTYPTGFMDVVTIPKTGENFRMLYDTKGRYVPVPIKDDEAKFKLGRVEQSRLGPGGVPFIVTHDGKTMRYPDPHTKVLDTVKIDLATMRPTEVIKFEIGCQVYINSGKNKGRVGILTSRDRHPGMFDIVHVRDLAGNVFSTRLKNVFVIGAGGKAKTSITLPKGKGVKLSITEERDRKFAERAKTASA
jgi:small subunit ribosomal protein S4e